ncbi:MAG TPA: YdeI/OmpD-associated family protein [Anaerolinea sp.]|nr:YdeI/OmpD-associated family protein [Anaerolinea sp.]
MSQQHTFRAVIESAGGGGAFVTIPFDVEQAFGKKRVRVKAIIQGVPYRGSLVRMGGDCHVLGILKEVREQIGKSIGDEIEVVVEEDGQPRSVEVPKDMQDALKGYPEEEGFFQNLSYSHQREYVRWIEDAKQAQTRQRRLNQLVELLTQRKSRRS